LGIDRSKLYRRLKQYGVMAVRFLQEEDIGGMQLLSQSEEAKKRSRSQAFTGFETTRQQ
jgi:hypothetical protein